MKLKKKVLSLILALTMIVGCIPMTMQVKAAGKQTRFETTYNSQGKATITSPEDSSRGNFTVGEWSQITVTLTEATETLQLFWNYEAAAGQSYGAGAVYVDNFKTSTGTGVFSEGVDFESEEDATLFDGLKWNDPNGQYDAKIERVAYAPAGIPATTDGGTYALKLSHTAFSFPRFEINFGETLTAGTVISFMAYGTVEYSSWIPESEKEPAKDYDYSFAVLGDIQNLNYHSAGNTDYLSGMYDWIVDNVEEKNIQFVMGLGDITENSTDAEYKRAKENFDKFEGVVPYSVIRGNHDTYAQYNRFFPYAEQESKLGGSFDGTMNNTWQELVVDANGETIKYLIFALDFGPTDEALAWAGDIIEKNPNHNVIITTHAYLYGNNGQIGTDTHWNFETSGHESDGKNNGDDIWDQLIRKYSNISMVLCGHDPQENIVVTKTPGDNGNVVTQMLIDPQSMDKAEPVGMVAMLYFSEGGSKVEVEYYSTVKKQYWKSINQFTTDVHVVDAEAEGPVVYELHNDLATFRQGEKTYPTGKAGYVFAGWYKLDGEQYVALSEKAANAATSAYAKFVDRDVLRAKYQLTANTTSFTDTTKLRMLTTVDTLNYQSVGFRLTIDGKTRDLTTDVVYKEIKATIDGKATTYSPKVFDNLSEFIMTHSISEIPNSAFAMGFRVEPIWTTLDGTIVSGVAQNFAIGDIVPDWEDGIDFEDAGDASMFTGQGSENDATITRVSYKDAGITAPEGGKKMALAIGSTTTKYPAFQINFGKELPIGTELKFMAHGEVDQAIWYNATRFEETETNPKTYPADVTTPNVINAQGVKEVDGSTGNFRSHAGTTDTWVEVTVRLNAAADHVKLFWNVAVAAHGYGTVYIDNLRVVLPAGDLNQGLTFEEEGNAAFITGIRVPGVEWADADIRTVLYQEEGISAPVGGGTHGLALVCPRHGGPRFAINLGEILPAGTKVKFMAYVNITPENSAKTRTRFMPENASNGKITIVSNEDTANWGMIPVQKWSEITVTLSEATNRIELYGDFSTLGLTSTGNDKKIFYLDNFVISQGEFRDGVDFEVAADTELFEGAEIHGDATYAVIERFQYDDVVAAPAEGGAYGMKLSSTKDRWPNFIMNFGQELPAGTKVTFMAYGTVDGTCTNNYTGFEVQGLSVGKATLRAAGDTSQPVHGGFTMKEWTQITVTLTEAATQLELFWNFERAKSDTVSGAVYVDNFKATLPGEEFEEGVDFETEKDVALFTAAAGCDSIERVQ